MFKLYSYNNGIVTGMKAMPLKDSTTLGDSNFALWRSNYANTLGDAPNTPAQQLQKKWIGGNRDASQVVERRRVASVGVGTMNATGGELSFMTKNDGLTRVRALNRVRNSGYCVPPKVRGGQYSSIHTLAPNS
jgi:hypothetical protein